MFVFMSLDYFIHYVFHVYLFACEFHYSLQLGQIPLCTGAIFSFFIHQMMDRYSGSMS